MANCSLFLPRPQWVGSFGIPLEFAGPPSVAVRTGDSHFRRTRFRGTGQNQSGIAAISPPLRVANCGRIELAE